MPVMINHVLILFVFQMMVHFYISNLMAELCNWLHIGRLLYFLLSLQGIVFNLLLMCLLHCILHM
jgi:hypothetical protein